MEGGGKIRVKNEHGISPLDLLPPLARLQQQLVADCWLGLVLEDAAHLIEQPEQGNDINGNSYNKEFIPKAIIVLGGTREQTSRSSRLFKKLHEARHHREKGTSTFVVCGN